MMNYCLLNIGWVNDELMYAEYRMSEWWIVVYWIKDEWMMNDCILNIGEWMMNKMYAEYRMSEWWMIVYWM